MRTSILGRSALLLALVACAHGTGTGTVPFNGEVPPLCPLSDPHLAPATTPGMYLLQLLTDSGSKDQPTYAFLIFVANGVPTVQSFVGPIYGDEDWGKFYNALGVLGSARPGGFWCDGVVQPPQSKAPSRAVEGGSHYDPPLNRCPNNPHALLAVPSDQRLASGPKPPSPPPPNITGFVQGSDTQDLTAMGIIPERRGMLASLDAFAAPPAGCQQLDPKDPRLKSLGTYVQRAVEAVNILSPPVSK